MEIWEVSVIASIAGTALAFGVHKYRANRRRSYFAILPSSLSGEPLKQRPPNIGGVGNPDYQGPNYLSPEETADYLRPIPHFGRMSLEEVNRGDLAWEFERGCVAPDGTIWLNPETRAAYGVVTVPAIEVPKAARFGWQLVEGSQQHGYCEVRRESM